MTRGRQQARHIQGGRRGYVPNELIVAEKMVEKGKRKLEQLNNLPVDDRIDAADKIIHMEKFINKYQSKLNK